MRGGSFWLARWLWLLYTPMALRGAAVGLLSQVLYERREHFHTLRLGEFLDPFNPPVLSFVEKAQARFLQYTGDPALSRELAWQALANLRQQQASDLAYFDC